MYSQHGDSVGLGSVAGPERREWMFLKSDIFRKVFKTGMMWWGFFVPIERSLGIKILLAGTKTCVETQVPFLAENRNSECLQ